VLGGLALLALTICLVSYFRRRRRRIADSVGRTDEMLPFATSQSDLGVLGDSKFREAAGGVVNAINTLTLKSRSRSGDQNSPLGSGYDDFQQPHQPNDVTESHRVGTPLSDTALVRIDEAVREELVALRTQVRQLQGARQEANSVIGYDDSEPPPEYSSVRDRGGP
jgi:hypothetical protein